MSRWHIVMTMFVAMLLISGCGTTSRVQIGEPLYVPIHRIGAPMGKYQGLAWLQEGVIVDVAPPLANHVFEGTLWQMQPDGTGARMLDLPLHPGCDQQRMKNPTRLPDARLGYVVHCDSDIQPAFDDELYMMAYDFTHVQATPLLSYAIGWDALGRGGFSWNPAMTQGVVDDRKSFDAHLHWLYPDRMEQVPMPSTLVEATGSAWSPDGKHIAFFGEEEQGREGMARIEAHYTLYLMNADGTNLRPQIPDLYYVTTLAWSPDNRWIVFSASRSQNVDELGLYIFDLTEQTYREIAHANLALPTWSPDGKQIVAVELSGDIAKEDRLVLLNLAPVVDEMNP